LKGRCRKYVFKSALRRMLPQEIIDREKMGFALPLAEWFRGGIKDFARSCLLETEDPLISSAFVRRIWDQHQSGRRDRSSHLWNIMMFRLWRRTYSGTV
jgi:asparagine synthase (glutamine-hydrolysing)